MHPNEQVARREIELLEAGDAEALKVLLLQNTYRRFLLNP